MKQCTNCLSTNLTKSGRSIECENCNSQYEKCNVCEIYYDVDDMEVLDGEPFGPGRTCNECITSNKHVIPRF